MSKDQLKVNILNYPKNFAKPLKLLLTAADGSIYAMNTKFWEQNQLKKILKEVWQPDVASPQPSINK